MSDMKITGYGPIGSTDGLKKARKASQTSNFADILAASEAEDAAAAAPAADVGPLSNLLALQEVSEEDLRRRKLVQRGNAMLDALDQWRRQLLLGSLSPQMIQELNHQISLQKQNVADPRLMEIIEDIELRAAVELAKIEKDLGGRI